eukprot:3941841-Rhodomonas_salina.2
MDKGSGGSRQEAVERSCRGSVARSGLSGLYWRGQGCLVSMIVHSRLKSKVWRWSEKDSSREQECEARTQPSKEERKRLAWSRGSKTG